MKNEIRTLKADEIECRVGTINEKGCSLLLYKDARVDMRLLDEVFGPMNWKRHHEVVNGNLYCTISIWDSEKKEWVSKQDVGTESNTEAVKGEASDSFKRAGFNWGIGRELYSAPFVWISLDPSEVIKNQRGNCSTRTKFSVEDIGYSEDREINRLVIIDDKLNVRYSLGSKRKVSAPKAQKPAAEQTPPEGMYTGAQLKQAVEMMNSCTSRAEVQNIWNQFKNMQKAKEFSDACMIMCKKFPK